MTETGSVCCYLRVSKRLYLSSSSCSVSLLFENESVGSLVSWILFDPQICLLDTNADSTGNMAHG